MKKLLIILAVFVALAGLSFYFFAGKKAAPTQSVFDALLDENAIEVTLETDLAVLINGKDTAGYHPAILKVKKSPGQEICMKAEVKPRGVYRKQICEFPPLKLDFSKKDLEAKGFKAFDDLKLVTHCKADPSFDELVIKEYLAFRTYNLLTDKSFRAQLAKVRYIDSKGNLPTIERFGFIIESPEELVDRLGGRILDETYDAPKALDKAQYKLFTVFQFMVGNTDWSLSNYHNAMMILPKEGKMPMPYPVPYDFDFSGMVGAPYAVPHHSMPISNVKERFFQWRGSKDEDFSDVYALFKSKREEMTNLSRLNPYLSEQCKKEVEEYLSSFYNLLETPEGIVRQ